MIDATIIAFTAAAALSFAVLSTRGMRPVARAAIMLFHLAFAAYLLPVLLWIPVYVAADFTKPPAYPPGFKDIVYFTHQGVRPMLPLNEDGLIADRRYKPGPSDKHRVVILGDSFAAGFGLTYEGTLGARLQSRLGPGYEVINGATFGSDAEMQVEYFYNALQKYLPRTIVLRFRRDDVMPLAEQLYLQQSSNVIIRYARHWPMALKNVAFKYEAYLIREKFWKLYRQNPRKAINANLETFYTRLGNYTRANNVDVLFVTDVCPYEYRKICVAAGDRAKMVGWQVVDPMRAVPPVDPAMSIPGDGHPTALANDRLAGLLAPMIAHGR